jgi:ABC-type bacteriocin/lantibiotic exporter with double-glycine peptidase domain
VKFDKRVFTLQQDQSDCGVACLLTVIQFHGGSSVLENLRKISGTSRQGTTLLGLLQAAQQVGFEAEGLEAEGVHNLSELKEPAILHVVMENRLQHYVVYYPQHWSDGSAAAKGKTSDPLQLFDPAKGIIKMSAEELDKIWQSKALLKLVPTEKFEKSTAKRSKIKAWIIGLVKEDAPILLVSLFLGIAISILGISTAIFSQKLIDDILPKENTQKLLLSLVLVTLLLLARSGLAYLRGLFMIRQGMDFNNRIIQRFYHNLLQLPKSFFDTRKTGELIARMNDTRRIQSVLSVVSGSMVIDFLLVAVSLGFVFTYSSTIGLIMLGSLPVYFLILLWFNKPIIRTQKEVMSGYAMAESNFVDTMQGVADIKLMNKQAFFEKINATVYGTFQQKMADLGHLNIKFSWVSEVTGVLFMISVFGFSSWLVLAKELKLGEMVALLSMAGSIIPSANRLVVANIQIQEALVAFDRMFEFTSMEKEVKHPITIKSFPETLADVTVHNVSFRFPGRKQILKDVSIHFKKGEMVALLGESGGGKSTLLQLVQKFYSPEAGEIQMSGIDISQIDAQEWREKIGSVPQDLKIFNGNLLYNITLSEQPEDYQRAVAFCEEKGFGKYFQEFPQSYLTLLGEEGVNLSGGQKQLVVLARALFRQPQILMLDEATSAMDRNTENFILSLLQKSKSEMAILLVTHRIKTAQRCDRIYILEAGTIHSSGTPNELMLTENFFSESYKELVS